MTACASWFTPEISALRASAPYLICFAMLFYDCQNIRLFYEFPSLIFNFHFVAAPLGVHDFVADFDNHGDEFAISIPRAITCCHNLPNLWLFFGRFGQIEPGYRLVQCLHRPDEQIVKEWFYVHFYH